VVPGSVEHLVVARRRLELEDHGGVVAFSHHRRLALERNERAKPATLDWWYQAKAALVMSRAAAAGARPWR
jgi:hypothetical protein